MQLLKQLTDEALKKMMFELYNKIINSNKKMASSTKFIDFFVHDILDYTMLNKNESKFDKHITIFNVKDSVNEIIETLDDKTQMKDIEIDTKYVGFENNNLNIQTDQKRMQQILLNLYSNAIKFTDRFGKVVIIVEKVRKNLSQDLLIISVIDSGIGIKY